MHASFSSFASERTIDAYQKRAGVRCSQQLLSDRDLAEQSAPQHELVCCGSISLSCIDLSLAD